MFSGLNCAKKSSFSPRNSEEEGEDDGEEEEVQWRTDGVCLRDKTPQIGTEEEEEDGGGEEG